MEEELDILDEKVAKVERPTFLTVLCILTFVGAGLGILSGIINMFATEFVIGVSRAGRSAFFTEDMADWMFLQNVINLVASLGCLAGALLMWQLKKVGYYIYIPSNLIPIVISIIGAGMGYTGVDGPFQGIVILGIIIGAIFPIGFIIMYGVNLKYMVK